jgi:2-oxoisovalerate dehydrogenase E2 component (dihydrolipoyl transacylase)
MSVLTLTLA